MYTETTSRVITGTMLCKIKLLETRTNLELSHVPLKFRLLLRQTVSIMKTLLPANKSIDNALVNLDHGVANRRLGSFVAHGQFGSGLNVRLRPKVDLAIKWSSEWRSITNRCLSLSLSLPEFDSRCLLATCWTKQAFLTGDLNLALCHSISRRARPLGDAAFDDGVMVLIIKRLL
ncbi:hypothetical protein T08_14369 [Trichinella sp. T8]|nr:hypothetical protein T08_14369 [Trichinella sp. T8]